MSFREQKESALVHLQEASALIKEMVNATERKDWSVDAYEHTSIASDWVENALERIQKIPPAPDKKENAMESRYKWHVMNQLNINLRSAIEKALPLAEEMREIADHDDWTCRNHHDIREIVMKLQTIKRDMRWIPTDINYQSEFDPDNPDWNATKQEENCK